MPQQVTWIEKVLSIVGNPPRRGEVPRLAAASGLPRRTLAAWLKGTNVPKDPTQNGVIASLAVALKVSPDWLLDGQPGAPPPPHEGGTRLCRAAGVTPVGGFKRLRHTYATLLDAARVDSATRRDLMAHAPGSRETDGYTHTDSARLRAGIAAIDKAVGG